MNDNELWGNQIKEFNKNPSNKEDARHGFKQGFRERWKEKYRERNMEGER